VVGVNLSLSDKQIYIILLALLAIATVIGIVVQTYAGTGTVYTEEESLEIARDIVMNSPTYAFDGYELVHKETLTAKCPYCWVFVFGFKSSHGGYGDRRGQVLAQVITQHTANVVVERGDVKSATLDGKWDMRNQQHLEDSGPLTPEEPAGLKEFTEGESLRIARQYVLDSPTYKFDGSSLEYNETIALGCLNCWQFISKFESSHAGYGDRTGQFLAQVITTHIAKITVISGNVSGAILDEKWDMIKQRLIHEEPAVPAEGFCGWSSNDSCNSDAGCRAHGCSNHVCISLAHYPMRTTCEWRDCYNASLYGLACKCVDNKCQWAE